MKTNLLHITNGDVTTSVLENLNLSGKIITWREMLCEGKTLRDVGSESFWKSRFDFFSKKYKVTKEQFISLTVREFKNLCQQKIQEEIVLWFEYDLFCQINMIAVISWLKKHRKGVQISLVCSGKEDDTNKMYGLSELPSERLLTLFEQRTILTKDDIEYADYLWQLYCADSPMQLQHIQDSPTFPYLKDAIKAHLLRFPTIKNGLNAIENKILEEVATHEFENHHKLVAQLLKDQDVYGFGDVQYYRKIEELQGLFKGSSPIELNDLGYDILQKKQNYYPTIKNDDSYLGGALKYDYLFNENNGKLLKL